MLEIIRRHSFFIAFFTLFLVIFFYESIEGAVIERISGFTMGTSYEIQLVDIPTSTNLEELSGGIAELLLELDREVFPLTPKTQNCQNLIGMASIVLTLYPMTSWQFLGFLKKLQ